MRPTIRSLVLAILALPVVFTLAQGASQGTLSALQTDVDEIARRARPAVVTVFAQRTLSRRTASNAAPERRLHTRVGSGVAIEESAILTTASVVLGAERTLVRTANGIQVEAEVAGIDPIFNLALLRVPSVRLPALRFADPHGGQVGSWVISLGTSYRAQPTQSVGNVAYRFREPHQSLLQLTNTVYPGNSGAAALNTRGELVGIVQGELGTPELADAESGGEHRPNGVSFALPVETIRRVYESLKREGRVHHGFLGITTRAASLASDEAGGPSTPLGAEIVSVVSSGPAVRAGLTRGDLIVAFDGERVEYPEQLARWVAGTPPGTSVELVWVRDENGHTAQVVLDESPDVVPQWVARDNWHDLGDPSPVRIGQLERQIRRLNEELARIKGAPATPPR